MTLNAWIISLNPENPVAWTLHRTLSEQGIKTEIKQAVDGRRQMPALQGREQLSQEKALFSRKAQLTSSEVGCYLSHYRLIQEAWDQGLSHICLFEDDVVAEPDIGDLLRRIIELDECAHLVRLMALKKRNRKVVQTLSAQYNLIRPLRGALGTQGYVLNRVGMKKILDFGATIYMPIDKLYDSFFLYGLKCFSVEPHAISEINRSTTVEKASVQGRVPLKVLVRWRLHKLYRSIHRYSYFLAYLLSHLPASRPPAEQKISEIN